MSTCDWPVGNARVLTFTVYPSDASWHNVGGLYVFAYLQQNMWYALYVGQTNDFSSRIPGHERWVEAVRRGATHVHAMVETVAANRDSFEEMLIRTLQPPMNDQLR